MYKSLIISSILLYLTVAVTCDINSIKNEDINKILKEASGHISSLNETSADEIKQYLQFGETLLKQKCLNVSKSEDSYTELQAEASVTYECVSNLVNVTKLQKEIEIFSKNGSLETVFNKYCQKRNIAIECLEKFSRATEPCLEPEEISRKSVVVDIAKEMLEFVCYKDGDHIALFIAEKGIECFTDRAPKLQECIEKVIAKYMPTGNGTTPNINVTDAKCRDMDPLRNCFVDELEKCENTTPANLVDAMFKNVKKQCMHQMNETAEPRTDSRGGATALNTPLPKLIAVLGTTILALYLKSNF
jgi:hypothetical protein